LGPALAASKKPIFEKDRIYPRHPQTCSITATLAARLLSRATHYGHPSPWHRGVLGMPDRDSYFRRPGNGSVRALRPRLKTLPGLPASPFGDVLKQGPKDRNFSKPSSTTRKHRPVRSICILTTALRAHGKMSVGVSRPDIVHKC